MKSIYCLLSAALLSGCAGMGNSQLAQTLHGDRVKNESDPTLCLRFLSSENNSLSTQVREIEIQKRNLDCSRLVSLRDIEVERRLRRAEAAARAAEFAADEANRRARSAQSAADAAARDAQNTANRQRWCSQGMKAFCR